MLLLKLLKKSIIIIKVYWSLLTTFLNNKKILIIPPLFYENFFITDFKEKAQLFNIFFSKQCFFIPNNSSLPADFNYITDKRLSTVTFSAKDIGKIIQNLDANKAHGHDNISICMLKICGDSICVPLEIIFKQALIFGFFPSEGKKEILFPFTKRASNKLLKTIDQILYFRFVVKFLKDLFFMKRLSIFPLINSSLKTSLVSNPVIPVSTNCYQLPAIFLLLLIIDYKLEVFSQTYRKLLIKSGMKGLLSN